VPVHGSSNTLTLRARGLPRQSRRSALLVRACAWLVFALSYNSTARTFAQPLATEDRPATDAGAAALRGVAYTLLPLSPRALVARIAAGYGITERLSRVPAAMHGLLAGLQLGVSPLPWLGVAVRADGRLEFHGDDGMGSHVSGFGDPRLDVRAGYALGEAWWLGGQLTTWFPGASAPSWVPGATSLDGSVLLAYQTLGGRYTLLASAGARWDNSAHAAPDRERLRPGDRIALGVSDSNAVLAAIGGTMRATERVDVFAQFSAAALVGSQAPQLGESPLRLAAGARYAVTRSLQADVTSYVSLSARPSTRTSAPFVPIEPRVAILLGIAYTLPLFRPAPAEAAPAKPQPTPAPPLSAPPPTAAVSGAVADDHGEPLPDTRIVLRTDDGQRLETMTDAHGGYRFADVPLGHVELESHAVGFATQTWALDVAPELQPEAPRKLVPTLHAGTLRGLIRSFDGSPLRATLTVRGARGKLVQTLQSAADGSVELELSAGRYSISIEAPGHHTTTQSVQISGNGVTVLNVDLRKQP
jgi:hypothetical protein